jgi:hypothetical protein
MEDNSIWKPGPKAILTYGSPFVDSENLFIEYFDILKCAKFTILGIVLQTEIFNQIFDTSELQGLNDEELYEWYINRRYRNVFRNFHMKKEALSSFFDNDEEKANAWVDSFEKQELEELPIFDEPYENNLKFIDVLRFLENKDTVKRIFIYTDEYSKAVQEDIQKSFGNNINYVYGDIGEIIRENQISRDTTFVFSDITKINKLVENNLLSYTSILIGNWYGYNYDDDENLVIDLEGITKDVYVKIYFFTAVERLFISEETNLTENSFFYDSDDENQ